MRLRIHLHYSELNSHLVVTSSNTTTTNSNNNGLQQTLAKLLLRISNMESSINDLQTRQVQIHLEALPSRSDTVREQDRLSLHAPVDQALSGGDLYPSAEELGSCKSENVMLLIK